MKTHSTVSIYVLVAPLFIDFDVPKRYYCSKGIFFKTQHN